MNDLLCTSPWDPSLKSLPPRGSDDYLTAIRELFVSASSLIRVVSPFIDADGVKQIAAWAANTSAKVRIYVREANPTLRQQAREHGWTIYEYQGTKGHDQRRGYHCKFFVADDKQAILGSVNLVYHNMIENLELGFRTDDQKHVLALVDVAAAIQSASRAI